MAKKEKDIKTNAVRMVETAGIEYQLKAYDTGGEFHDGLSIAKATGTDPDMVFKTLVLVGHSGEHYVCVIPVAAELDLKKAARHFDEKSLEMIHVKEINALTGYIRGGCSPVGMKKLFPTAIDETALLFDNIFVSGGKIGLQMELDPEKLASLVGGDFADLVK